MSLNASFELPFYDPDYLMSLAEQFQKNVGTQFFYSAIEENVPSKTYLCLFPIEQVLLFLPASFDKRTQVFWHQGSLCKKIASPKNPWEVLKEFLVFPEKSVVGSEIVWSGYLSYEMGAFSDPMIVASYALGQNPDAYFQKSACVIEEDKLQKKVTVFYSPDLVEKNLCVSSDFTAYLALTTLSFHENFANQKRPIETSFSRKKCVLTGMDRTLFMKNVQKVKEEIIEGNVYQANISYALWIESQVSSFSIFKKAAHINPTEWMAYLNYGNYTIVSTSPELFIRCQDKKLQSRPIKGTSPRKKDLQEDAISHKSLVASSKEKAELLMITDLMRNDLSKISLPGSVVCLKIMEVATFSNVYHLFSVIESEPVSFVHPLDMLRSLFPAASISGCPKLSAQKIIYAIEKRNRGIYTGAIGFFTKRQEFVFSVAIRILDCSGSCKRLQVGGGIVIDSDPESEYWETVYKIQTFRQILWD